MYYDSVPIINGEKADSLVKSIAYKKDGKITKVLYYNNGLVSESIDGEVTNRRIISEDERQTIRTEYERIMITKKRFDEAVELAEKNQKRAMELDMIARSCRY